MTRTGLRVALWVLLAVGVGAAAWQYYRLEADSTESLREAVLLDGFRDQVLEGMSVARTAQQAYVAPGQGVGFWQTRFAEAMADVTTAVENLRVTAEDDSAAAAALESAERALRVYEALDGKIRGFVAGGSLIMAADVIYEDGVKTSSLVVGGVTDAHRLLATPHRTAADANRQQQRLIAAGAVAGALLVALLLVPRGGRDTAGTSTAVDDETVETPTRRFDAPPSSHDEADADLMRPAPAPVAVPAGAPAAALPPAGDTPAHATAADRALLAAAADVCTDLARVKDGDELREALGRAARALDASGVIVWIADGSGRALKPLLTYGYPEEALRRIPTLPRDADNATAAAWREGTVQVVDATEAAPGAVAVPILAPQGCTGVLAAEIGHHREASPSTRAVGQLIAAQLAVLIPPESPPDTPGE